MGVIVLERNEQVGGLAGTLVFGDYRFGQDGHRFYSPWPDVINWIVDMMDGDVLGVVRRSRIFLNGRYLDYPLQFSNALTAVSPTKAAQVFASYLKVSLGRNGYFFYSGLTSAIGMAPHRFHRCRFLGLGFPEAPHPDKERGPEYR